MKSNLFNLLSLLVVLTLLLTTSGTPVTAQVKPSKPNPRVPSMGTPRLNRRVTQPAMFRPAVTPSDSLPSTLATQAHVRQSFGQLPLYFVENQGQLDERVAYYVQGSDKTLYFTPDGVTFALTAPPTPTQRPATDDRPTRSPRPLGDDETSPLLAGGTEGGYQRWAVKLDFVNANPNVRPLGQDKTEAVISYFKGKPDEWHAGLPTYASIIYPDLWPGIDLVYYGTVNQLKYEFVVHPGADPNQIRLAYRGAGSVTLNESGQMQVTTPLGGFTDDTPIAYQEMDGQRVTVPMAYQTSEVSASHSTLYGFVNSSAQASSISSLAYSTFLGGSNIDDGEAIAVDATGSVYVTGGTQSFDFPVTSGAFSTTYRES